MRSGLIGMLTKVAKALTSSGSSSRSGSGTGRRRVPRRRQTDGSSRPSPPAPSTPRPADDGIRFEYAPELDGDPDPGEVVWTWVAYEDDPSQGKDRPVVIVGRRGRGLVGVALTSQRRDGRGADEQFPVGTGSWDREGRPSWAKLDRLLDIAPSAVRREGAVLDRRRFDDLVAAVRRFHT